LGLDSGQSFFPYSRRLRELNWIPDTDFETFRKGIANHDPASSANVIIGLIQVSSNLLDRQLKPLEAAFLKEGGLRECMTKARLEAGSQGRR